MRFTADGDGEQAAVFPDSMTAFIVMGVAGSGKSTVGRAVAEALAWPFIEGDEFHPPSNTAKMARGVALTDADRIPWIESLISGLNAVSAPHTITACSALTPAVRARLQAGIRQPVEFILLWGPASVLETRLRGRQGHFMKADMLASQLAALDPPCSATLIDIDRPFETVCAAVKEHVLQRSAARD